MNPKNPLMMFVENDGVSVCVWRILAFVAGVVMIYKFAVSPTPDYGGLAKGLLSIAFGVVAKFMAEGRSGGSDVQP